jgi:hypothetical protein
MITQQYLFISNVCYCRRKYLNTLMKTRVLHISVHAPACATREKSEIGNLSAGNVYGIEEVTEICKVETTLRR